MSVKINEPTRHALAGVALANIGIGLILIGPLGLGPASTLFTDIVGWLLVAEGALALLWEHLSGRQLDRQFRKARHVDTKRGKG